MAHITELVDATGKLMAGATIGQTFAFFVTENATIITTMSIALTSIAGLGFGAWSKINESKRIGYEASRIEIEMRRVSAQEEANNINKRAISETLITSLGLKRDELYSPEQIQLMLRK